jgi:ketosteroid isomerase-like protein
MPDKYNLQPPQQRAAAQTLIESVFAADAARDLDGFMALLAPDITLRLGSQPELHGQAAVRAAIGGLFGMLAGGIQHRLIAVWGGGDVLAYQAEAAFSLQGGRSVTLPYVNVLRTASDGLVAEYRIHIDPAPLFQPG